MEMLETINRKLKSFLNSRYLLAVSSGLFVIVLILSTLLNSYNAGSLRRKIEKKFNQQQLTLAHDVSSQIVNHLDAIRSELVSLIRIQAAKRDYTALKPLLQGLLDRSTNLGILEAGIVENSGILLEATAVDGHPDADISEVLFEYRRMGPGRIEFSRSWIEKDNGSGAMMVMISTPIPLIPDSMGLLYALVDITRLVSSSLGNMRFTENGHPWIIDDERRYIYHADSALIGEQADSVMQGSNPDFDFSHISMIMKAQVLLGREGVDFFTVPGGKSTAGNIRHHIAYSPVKHSLLSHHAWSVAVVTPADEVFYTEQRVYNALYGLGMIAMCAMFGLGIYSALFLRKTSRSLEAKVKRTEADLFETEQIYQRIVEQTNDLIYILDLNMRVVLLNQNAVRIFSQLAVREPGSRKIPVDSDLNRSETYLGRRLDELFRAKDWEFVQQKMRKVEHDDLPVAYEHSVETANGNKIRFSTILTPIRDDHGMMSNILGTSRDVTEKTEFEQQMYQTEKLASIGTLAAGVAHEINNPLAIMLGFTELLKDRFKVGSREYEDLKIIEANGNIAKKVVENLLGFARVSEAKTNYAEVIDSIETVLNIMQHLLKSNDIDLVVEMEDDLPQVRGDSRELQQVIMNLINNAMFAMKGSKGRIAITVNTDGDWVYIHITDEGKGIADRHKPRIFDPFFTTKKEGEGTGLGLWLSYGIINRFGGKIIFKSVNKEDYPDRNSGTTFTVTLPVYKDGKKAYG